MSYSNIYQHANDLVKHTWIFGAKQLESFLDGWRSPDLVRDHPQLLGICGALGVPAAQAGAGTFWIQNHVVVFPGDAKRQFLVILGRLESRAQRLRGVTGTQPHWFVFKTALLTTGSKLPTRLGHAKPSIMMHLVSPVSMFTLFLYLQQTHHIMQCVARCLFCKVPISCCWSAPGSKDPSQPL